MALTATIYNLDVQLADTDRGVYESLSFKVAQQPSESDEHMMARVLAYCLEYTEGIGFSKGIAEPEEPALFVRDLTGALRTWIDIGSPDAARLHKASKAAPRVVVYTHKDPAQLVRAPRRRTHPPRRSARALRPRSHPDRRPRISPRSTHEVRSYGDRRAPLRDDRRRDAGGNGRADRAVAKATLSRRHPPSRTETVNA
jgi:hypothetical protein